MSRDQRTVDNWALSFAYALSRERGTGLLVIFCLAPEYLGANVEHFRFMLNGLHEISEDLAARGVEFHLLVGDPVMNISKFVNEVRPSAVVYDTDPLRIKRAWREGLIGSSECGIVEVDAHNIVPCWAASPKEEYTAATFRPKVLRLLPEFVQDLPKDVRIEGSGKVVNESTIEHLERLDPRHANGQRIGIEGGQTAASQTLNDFIMNGLKGYSADRNDPIIDGQSGLSPYLHFGMISSQRVARSVIEAHAHEKSKGAFLEELIVRRELSENFCHYNPQYDSYGAFPNWAMKTLEEHLGDRREYIYSLKDLELGRTHDPLWNAAQMQMVRTGRMHGYMRMYWGKKVLEWSETPQAALANAVELNDRYELDGRDPNGYAGIAWCIGGLHDRPWPERPIFGKVRYMSINGARGKFDVDGYIERYGG
jgi:deoxyribodipyrimidine photo-lyase